MNIEELENKDVSELTPEEAKVLAKYYSDLSAKFTAYEQAVKVTLNSIYGAFGNKWFHFFNLNIAESITLQGQDAILYSEKILNQYFNNFFHKDKIVHEHFNIKVKHQLIKPSVIYIDTDSCYVQFEEMYNSIEWLGEPMQIDAFVLEIYNFRLNDYIVKCMEKYAEEHNTDNFLVFELETVAYSGIWMSKKKYIQNIAWDDKLEVTDRHPSLKKIKTIGFDTIQSSTPKFARGKLAECLKILFTRNIKPTAHDMERLVNFLKESKKEFKVANVEDISFNKRTNNIDKYIVDDHLEFQFASKTPPNVKAAGYYNYILNNAPKYKNKYKLIGNGEKLKSYYCIGNGLSDMFAYMPGEHPYEFAPAVDFDIQFEKCMIDPINRVLKSIGLQQLDTNLIYASSLF